jgi:hypothetical protein
VPHRRALHDRHGQERAPGRVRVPALSPRAPSRRPPCRGRRSRLVGSAPRPAFATRTGALKMRSVF